MCPELSCIECHSKEFNLMPATYRFACKAACLIGQSPLEDLMHPSRSRVGIAIVVLTVQRAVSKAAIGLFLLPFLLKKICDCVEQVVQELVSILLHVVVKQFWRKKTQSIVHRILRVTKCSKFKILL